MSIAQYRYEQANAYQKERMHFTRSTAATSEPMTVDEAIRTLQLAVSDDNSYIQALIQVARDVAENATGRALISSTWVGVCEQWPNSGRIELSVAPVSAVSSVKYYADGASALTTVDGANYTVSTGVMPAVITLGDSFSYPSLANRPDAIQVTFTAGYANDTAVPPALKYAVRILLRHYYDNPEAAATGNFNELPFGLRHLLESHRVCGWVA